MAACRPSLLTCWSLVATVCGEVFWFDRQFGGSRPKIVRTVRKYSILTDKIQEFGQKLYTLKNDHHRLPSHSARTISYMKKFNFDNQNSKIWQKVMHLEESRFGNRHRLQCHLIGQDRMQQLKLILDVLKSSRTYTNDERSYKNFSYKIFRASIL